MTPCLSQPHPLPDLYDRRGRPSLYRPLLSCLAPEWLYNPASISVLLAHYGLFAQLIDAFPENTPVPVLQNRARVALGRYYCIANWPQKKDGWISVRGRQVPTWFGWRWQGYSSLEQASVPKKELLAVLPTRLRSKVFYSLGEVMNALFEPVAFVEGPMIRGCTIAEPEKLRRLWAQRVLLHHALALGLDPQDSYPGSTWCMTEPPPLDNPVHLAQWLQRLYPDRTYTLAEIVARPLADGLIECGEEQAERAWLHRTALAHCFPEAGDVPGKPDTIPTWAGSRWHKLFENLTNGQGRISTH